MSDSAGKRPFWAILDEHNLVVPCTMEAFFAWREENHERLRVRLTEITSDLFVSTVFLGMNMHPFACGPDLWFETMAFGTEMKDLIQKRYETYEEAVAGHEELAQRLRLVEDPRGIRTHPRSDREPD